MSIRRPVDIFQIITDYPKPPYFRSFSIQYNFIDSTTHIQSSSPSLSRISSTMSSAISNSNHTNVNEYVDDDQSTNRRIRLLSLHLNPPILHHDHQLQLEACSGRTKMNVDAEKLTSYLRGKHRDVQEKIFEYFNSRPDLQTPIEILKDDYRELCMRQLVGLVREAGIRPFRYVVEDPLIYFAMIEAIGSVDMSLGIKLGVQYR